MPHDGDLCWVQCVPRLTVWEDSNSTPRSDLQLFDRNSDADRRESWLPKTISDAESCSYWGHDDAASFLLEWRPVHENYDQIWLSIVDADHHVLTRHEFEPVIFQDEQGSDIGRVFQASVEDGADTNEFIITFADWCRAIPMTLSVEAGDDATTPASIVETAPHVWTFIRATKGPPQFLTYLTINGTRLTISSLPSETAETIETKLATTDTRGSYAIDDPGRYDVYRHKETFGDHSALIADPSLLFVELRLAGVQSPTIARKGQSLVRQLLQIQVLEEPGWYVENPASAYATNTIEIVADDIDYRDWDGAEMSSDPVGTVDREIVDTRWTVQHREGQWSVKLGVNRSNSHRRETLFVPTGSEDIAMRAGEITFIGERPYSPTVNPDGSEKSTGYLAVDAFDPVGKQIKLYVSGPEQHYSHAALTYNGPSRTLPFTVSGWSGALSDSNGEFGNATPPNVPIATGFSSIFPSGTYILEFVFSGRSAEGEVPDGVTVTASIAIFGAGYDDSANYERSVKLVLSHVRVPNSGPIEYWHKAFVPTDGRIILDDVYDDEITWTREDGLDPEVVVTGRGWSQQGDCENYEDRQFESPVLQKVTWKNEEFLLPRTGPRRWSRIVDTADGERLQMLLEYQRRPDPLDPYPIGWQVVVSHADEIAMPVRSLFRFVGGGSQRDSQFGERPPFNSWRADAPNELLLIWHREHEDRLPASVTVEPVASDDPRGTSTWTWATDTDEWILTTDNSAADHEPQPLTNRGVNDGETRTIGSVRGFQFDGTPVRGGEVIYWSPDGVDWVKLLDNVTRFFYFDASPTPPPAPTHTPAGPGDIYRALAIYPGD